MRLETRKKWKRHYEEWKGSGETQRIYCEKAGIKYSTFKNIPGRFKEQNGNGKFHLIKVIETDKAENKVTRLPYCKIAFSSEDEITISSAAAMGRLRGLMT